MVFKQHYNAILFNCHIVYPTIVSVPSTSMQTMILLFSIASFATSLLMVNVGYLRVVADKAKMPTYGHISANNVACGITFVVENERHTTLVFEGNVGVGRSLYFEFCFALHAGKSRGPLVEYVAYTTHDDLCRFTIPTIYIHS